MNSAGLLVLAVAGLLLLLPSLAWVLAPLRRDLPPREPADPRVLALLAEREALLATLRDLEADHRDGRLSEANYAPLRAGVLSRGSAVLAALDRLAAERSGEVAELAAELERDVVAAGGGAETAFGGAAVQGTGPGELERRFCSQCGRAVSREARFCEGGGQPLGRPTADEPGATDGE